MNANIKTLAAAVMTSADLDELYGALYDLQEALDEYNEGEEDEDGYWHSRDERLDMCDVVALDDLPTWGDEPQNTLGVFSYDETRLLYIDGREITLQLRDDEDEDSSEGEEFGLKCHLGY